MDVSSIRAVSQAKQTASTRRPRSQVEPFPGVYFWPYCVREAVGYGEEQRDTADTAEYSSSLTYGVLNHTRQKRAGFRHEYAERRLKYGIIFILSPFYEYT